MKFRTLLPVVAIAVLAGAFTLSTFDKAKEPIKGLWARDLPKDGVRFYYFHGDGNGLYRYGRTAFTNTNSYDYTVSGDEITLNFRKTGERATMNYALEGEGDERVLVVKSDPREAGATVRYRYVPVEAVAASKPSGRMWIDLANFKTGGMAFSMYQLTPAGIDGRGTGWHHRGDFNDWSTEAMTYRMKKERIEIRFELTGETYSTPYTVVDGDDGRVLKLSNDPRNWWQRSDFKDMGKSFEVSALAGIVGL